MSHHFPVMQSPAVFIPQCQPMPILSHLATLIPPLRQRTSHDMVRPKLPPETKRDSPKSKADLKERNRLAKDKGQAARRAGDCKRRPQKTGT
jgi:hypothetical protein